MSAEVSEKPSIINSPEELKKIELPLQEVENYKAEVASLSIQGVEDKEGYRKVEESWRKIRNRRLEIDKAAEALKAPALAWQRTILAKHKEITDPLTDLEKICKNLLKQIDDEKERLKKQKELEEQKRITDRSNLLHQHGFSYGATAFSLENIVVPHEQVKSLTDEAFASILSEAEKINQRVAEQKAAEEAERKRIAEEQAAKKAELDRKEKELADRQAELDRKDQERVSAEKEAYDAKIRSRIQNLNNLGLVLAGEFFVFPEDTDVKVARVMLDQSNDQQWSLLLEDMRAEVEAAKLYVEQQKKEEEKLRLEYEESIKPEKQKIAEYLQAVLAVKYPSLDEIKDDSLGMQLAHAVETIENAAHTLLQKIGMGVAA